MTVLDLGDKARENPVLVARVRTGMPRRSYRIRSPAWTGLMNVPCRRGRKGTATLDVQCYLIYHMYSITKYTIVITSISMYYVHYIPLCKRPCVNTPDRKKIVQEN